MSEQGCEGERWGHESESHGAFEVDLQHRPPYRLRRLRHVSARITRKGNPSVKFAAVCTAYAVLVWLSDPSASSRASYPSMLPPVCLLVHNPPTTNAHSITDTLTSSIILTLNRAYPSSIDADQAQDSSTCRPSPHSSPPLPRPLPPRRRPSLRSMRTSTRSQTCSPSPAYWPAPCWRTRSCTGTM